MIRKGQSHVPGISTGSAADLFYSLAVCPSGENATSFKRTPLLRQNRHGRTQTHFRRGLALQFQQPLRVGEKAHA